MLHVLLELFSFIVVLYLLFLMFSNFIFVLAFLNGYIGNVYFCTFSFSYILVVVNMMMKCNFVSMILF